MIYISTKFHFAYSNDVLVIANTTEVKGNILASGSLVIYIARK
jgi:hypothetical protein